MVFMYAGTASLSRELPTVLYTSLQPGDVFIKGGSPGHAVIVMDVAIHPNTGKKVFLPGTKLYACPTDSYPGQSNQPQPFSLVRADGNGCRETIHSGMDF